MKTKNLLYIIILNIMGAALFLSWYLPENHGFWFEIDKSIFYFFNNLLVENKAFMYLVGVTNMRVFDSVASALIILSWILLTPFADRVIGILEKKLPLRYFSK